MEESRPQHPEDNKFSRLVIQGWIIVCGIAVLFVLYGLLTFFVVGDKGPRDWDYGSIEDTPGESVYSTYPGRDFIPPPDPQHINEATQEAAPNGRLNAPD